MKVLLYQQAIDDKKNNIKWKKDKVSYRHKNFDAILENQFKPQIQSALASGLEYPLELELADNDYFIKTKKYTRADGTNGQKPVIVIGNVQSIAQGQFDTKSLDEVVDELEEATSQEEAE